MSASKLDGSNADSGERKKPGTSKGATRALFPQELEAGLTLPDPAERRKILERAGMLIAEARALLDRLDEADKKAATMISADKLKARSTRSEDAER